MTSVSSETRPSRTADLGTLALLAWMARNQEGEGRTPCLLACSLGDGPGGPEAASAAVERLLGDMGLPVGGEPVNGTRRPSLKVSMLVAAGQIVLQMPNVTSQVSPPADWLKAVEKLGYTYFMFTTRICPSTGPRQPVAGKELAAFAGDPETTKAAAHVYLPARSLRV
ncbi:hypothetical protein JK359_01190 [Streptomyces actinomycinicus]|uniref:Uncharacterized protein n=1 Tax=Streptomyces actinomycinicus TaxID=1695166 RepID=A0A937ED92_9ACTN|nr:DUF5949 family protein [Streptomyces actinomycinicus]MBL1080601.1 hypothetical protein [Streptomyces actinomycinicus]